MTTMFLMRWLRGESNKCGLRDEIWPILGSMAMPLSLGISDVLSFMSYGLVKLGKGKSMGCVRDLMNCTITDIDGIDKKMYD